MTTTRPVRVSEEVHAEVSAVSRMLGESPAQLLKRAWDAYKATPSFDEDFKTFQQAFASGDLEAIVQIQEERVRHRAQEAAARAAS